MGTYNFTVDAALLRELGERLVGRPYMALAELIKNSYDADATAVEIAFSGGEIVVSDNGHGMSETDFAERWMRIGTTGKTRTRRSPRLNRALTGSKGVGRLAVQILGSTTTVSSVALADPAKLSSGTVAPIEASIDWSVAVNQGALTSVKVVVRPPSDPLVFPRSDSHGTVVRVGGLTDAWNTEQFVELAREIWSLRPPFDDDSGSGMSVSLTSDHEDVSESFDEQMNAILDIWTAKISGKLLPANKRPAQVDGVLPPKLPTNTDVDTAEAPATRLPDRYLRIVVEMRDSGSKRVVHYRIPGCPITDARFDIRVFNLQHRQPRGIGVGDARDYLRRFGGVGIYDEGFRLPYYGVDQDWLNSERDHARRLDRSKLVPDSLHVKRGLQDLPPNARMYGAVHVSTGHEAKVAACAARRDPLSIQVSRDRLTDNAAYQQLRVLVRAGIDLFAMEAARVKLVEATKRRESGEVKTPSDSLGALASLVTSSRSAIPEELYVDLTSAIDEAKQAARDAEASSMAYASLLGALATAGSTSLAYEHEISKQVAALSGLADDLTVISNDLSAPQAKVVLDAVARMRTWEQRIAGIRAVFGPLLSKESRDTVSQFRARSTVRKVAKEIEPLANGIKVNTTGIPDDVMLRSATLPAWTSILQNLLLNAYNALSDVADPRISVTAEKRARRSYLTILDNGVGVNLEIAEKLWQPFERDLLLSPEKEAAGLGGMGLGLTIVRMIGDEIGVNARFVKPPLNFSTAVQLDWERDDR